jgi:hypothetical protein
VRLILASLGLSSHNPQPDVEWNGETRTCIITEVSRGLPNNALMFATDVTLFVIILCGVYRRNSGRHILSTMHREVGGLCTARIPFLTSSIGSILACDCDRSTTASRGEKRVVRAGELI